MNIVFPDKIDLSESSRRRLKKLGATFFDDTPNSAEVIIDRIKDAEIITANFIDITAEMIDAVPKLKIIIVPAVGYEWVDHEYAAKKGILVLNCPTQNSDAVAEHAIALMLDVCHRISEASVDLQSGNWSQLSFIGAELSHKKLGLVGYGKIGKIIEKRVSGFEVSLKHADSKTPSTELDEIIQWSDFVCLCLPLNDSTRGIMDKRRLGLLKPSSIFVNVARGGLVDEAELYRLLEAGSIRGAGLDVFNNEAFTANASENIVGLAKLPNVVATPHIAFNTQETAARLGDELVANIESCLAGTPINVVN